MLEGMDWEAILVIVNTHFFPSSFDENKKLMRMEHFRYL